MKRHLTPALLLGALALAPTGAAAQPLSQDATGLTFPSARTDSGTRSAEDDLFSTAITVHTVESQSFLDTAPDVHIFGGTDFMGLSTLEPTRALHVITSEATVAPNTVEFVIEWGMDDGGAFLPSGASLGQVGITSLGFHLGQGPAPDQPIGWDPNPGFDIISSTFELFDLQGVDLLQGVGVFDASDNGGTGLSGVAVVSAENLSAYDAAVARATITIRKVPAPSGLAVLGVTGAIASRRRRR